jgi:serine/threonine-protein kinase
MAVVEDIFFEALSKPVSQERRAYLAEACRHDAHLLRRVEQLLRAHERLGGFLECPATLPETPLSDALPARYRVAGELGRGGMGVVYAARDEQFGREVAIKALAEGRPELARRFVEEARIAGRLQHPGVVPVYEMGADQERPYFTMKLVRGRTLADLLRERVTPAKAQGKFLGYFEQACQAVAYAHSRGVVHRDLKPANIMVGDFGEVQVMDWGLAKVLPAHQTGEGLAVEEAGQPTSPSGPDDTGADGDSRTQAGSVLGTPAYMAPEQARGENASVGARADVFSMGAVLCEILTGLPPHTGTASHALHQARTADLVPAFTLLDDCGADAELIGLTKRCLAPCPDDRLAHAGELAEALAAHRRSVEERLQRAELERAEARVREAEGRTRLRLAVGLAAAVLALVLVGAGAALRMQQLDSQRREEAARLQAERRRDVEAALAKADKFGRQERWAEARAVLEQARRQLPDEGEDGLAGQIDAALGEIALVERLEDARARGALWRGSQAGPLAGLDREYEKAFRAAGLGGPEAPPEQVAERVRASRVREALLSALVDWAANKKTRERVRNWAVATARLVGAGLSGPTQLYEPDSWGSREGLEKLAREVNPDRASPLWLRALVLRLRNQGYEYEALLRKAVDSHPGDFWLALLLSDCLLGTKRDHEAIGFLRAALALRSDNSAAHCNLGYALRVTGQPAEALGHLQKAVREDPSNAAGHYNLGLVFSALGNNDKAKACFKEASRVHPRYAPAASGLGYIALFQNDLDEARKQFEITLALDPTLAEELTHLGSILIDQGQVDAGVKRLREAIRHQPGLLRAHFKLGVALLEKLGKVDEAVSCFEKAVAIKPAEGASHFNLGIAYSRQGQWDKGIDSYLKAAELGHNRERARENASTLLARRLEAARAHAFRRNWKAAAEVYERHSGRWQHPDALFEQAALRLLNGDEKGHREECALLLKEHVGPGDKARLAVRAALLVATPAQNPQWLARLSGSNSSLTLQGALHLRAGELETAEALFRRALKEQEGKAGEALSQAWLAVTSARQGEAKAARQWREKAVAWADRAAPAKTGVSMHDWLELHVLLREAERLDGGPAN